MGIERTHDAVSRPAHDARWLMRYSFLSFNRTEKITASKPVLVVLDVFGCAGLTRERGSLFCLLNRSPLMLSHDNTEQRVERVRVRLQGSSWSVPFGLDEVSYVLARERRRCALNRSWRLWCSRSV